MEFYGPEVSVDKISGSSYKDWRKQLFLVMSPSIEKAVIFGAEYFYYSDSNSHQTSVFE